MQDLRLFIDKLHTDAQACETIGQTALNEGKRKIFAALADTYRTLASEMEKIAAAHAILDEEREKNLLGVLGGNTSTNTTDRLAEIAKVLSSATDQT
jgi:4-hydroxy-3-methylbut-2-enyl diphosphate reductase IspH